MQWIYVSLDFISSPFGVTFKLKNIFCGILNIFFFVHEWRHLNFDQENIPEKQNWKKNI